MPAKKVDFELDRTVTHRLHTLSKLTDRVSQAAYLQEAGIPLNEGRCLAAVGAFAPLSVNDLARLANLTKGQASRAAQTLVDRGFVDKQTSALDARGVVLRLTPLGQQTWRRVKALIRRRNEEIVACLDAAEREQLDRLLDRLVEHAVLAAGDASEVVE
ncbi:MarR family winged helix-turn-helix transcriptional regulator [Azohydromonas caseinilytica]|uniref:Winged helix-turn-helix transcriptional regulator n=1 Tax=Azohydromonas caseinilytica TaxID=2728836 RepID=A0A848FCN0_9BURK|nr:MarR family winged helix-turn-helix transcriptional regulator [Azohydromonas caseinilytica]NML17977.1 winged helix-turn-helix transcriptional regulator [Azohydromonas caseinilytica]